MSLKSFRFISPILFLLTSLTIPASKTQAQSNSCNYYLGDSVSGTSISVALYSVKTVSDSSKDFVYCLGNEAIYSQAHCDDGTWTTFPERALHSPESQATENMISIVCSAPDGNPGVAIGVIFDPPSNVRDAPNGNILCTVDRVMAVVTGGGVTNDGWTRTSICGETGMIHTSQIRYGNPVP